MKAEPGTFHLPFEGTRNYTTQFQKPFTFEQRDPKHSPGGSEHQIKPNLGKSEQLQGNERSKDRGVEGYI